MVEIFQQDEDEDENEDGRKVDDVGGTIEMLSAAKLLVGSARARSESRG